ncbi:HAD family hydrolase [Schumannella luteola]|uniref:Sugar-phosphatase n=1 Tax=Schumannella luteola TaxID=472059 RepID=A0A852Y8E7_9MICO|nr:HAD-IA family hydrolase [Schumannella luteola]NYG97501.1 sugar-phosphatase [Schumannella luteola]TPX01524.1 HAD-IA family hydrolase [Schumannella luteola]
MVRIPVEGVLFDCDGVLVDSLESAARAWGIWAARWAPAFDFRRDIVHGVRAVDTVRSLVAADDVERANAELERLEVEHVDGTRAIPGAVELTDALPQGLWTVVTSGARELAARRLASAGVARPDGIVAAEDVARGKPDPEPYRRGAELIERDPARCVVFEDAPAGIAAARAAGVGTVIGVGLPAGAGSPDLLVADLRAVSWVDGALVVAPLEPAPAA